MTRGVSSGFGVAYSSGQRIQTGNAVATTDGAGQHAFTFPAAFRVAPVVVASGGNDEHVYVIPSPSTTGFTAQFRTPAGVLITSAAVRIYYIAVGS